MEIVIPEDGRQSQAALSIRRGVGRFLAQRDFVYLPELTMKDGRRADLVALNSKGAIWIIEIKSSLADFRADKKWPAYLDHCDRFFFATTPEVPLDIFPENVGLLVADGFGAELIRDTNDTPLSAARRRSVTLLFARQAGKRIGTAIDGEIYSASIT